MRPLCRALSVVELLECEGDDVDFVAIVQRVLNGALAALDIRETYIVQVDNWFDHKWLGWRMWKGKELSVPPFTPNRVRSQRHLSKDRQSGHWADDGPGQPLHVRQPGRAHLAKRLDAFSPSAAFVWYSGNSAVNRAGSLMLYLSGAMGYSWYASFTKNRSWQIRDEYRVTRAELISFEERGRQLEAV